MGCDQSRDKTKEIDANATAFAKAADFAVAKPISLHLFEEYTGAYTIFNVAPSPTNSSPTSVQTTSSIPSMPSTPKSLASPKSMSSPTSLKRSLATKRSSSLPKSSKAFHTMSTARLVKLKTIAKHKFNTFHKFSKLVQEQIIFHIDKELKEAQ